MTSVLHEELLAKVLYVAQVIGDPSLAHYHCLTDLEWVQIAALHRSTNCAFQLYLAARLGLNLMNPPVASVVQLDCCPESVPREAHLYGALPLPQAPSAKWKPFEIDG